MERYCRHIVYRRYAGEGARDVEVARPHVSFDTLVEAAEYVGYANADDNRRAWTYEYSIIDVEHLHLGDMLKAEEARHLVEPALARGEKRWEET